jgi:2,5-diketo-D-gluconate reductase A
MTSTAEPTSTATADTPMLLRHGARLPRIGLGTSDGARHAVEAALRSGYRLIDTAFSYGNEAAVGEAIRASGVPRDEIFVTSKFNREDHGVDEVRAALERSLDTLGLDRLDLQLIHWPNPAHDRYVDAWRGLVHLLEEGRLRAIGVSNFKPEHLERIIDATGVAPDVNQIELNPYVPRAQSRAVHERLGIATQAWSPLGRGQGILQEPAIQAIAGRLGKTPSQVVLRWHLQLGVSAIPRSENPERQRENLAVFDFELSADDLA